MVSIINNNPFRVLGVYSNATLKEITANKTKLAAYAKVGRDVAFDADMNSLLPAMSRTLEVVEKAFADLTLPMDKIKYALFWFVKDNSFDEIGLGHIAAGDFNKADEIFCKKESWSSLLNSGALAIARKDLGYSVGKVTKVIHNDEYRHAFAQTVCGDTFQISEGDLAKIYIDSLLEQFDSESVVKEFGLYGISNQDDEYLANRVVDEPAKRINAEIAKAKAADGDDPDESYEAGVALINNTKSDLAKLKKLSTHNPDKYRMVADSLAKQILQCGINYYNNSLDDEYEEVEKAMELQGYALKIAEGDILKGRCKENIAILERAKNRTREKELVDAIVKHLNSSKDDTIDEAQRFIIYCAPFLIQLREILGIDDAGYLKVSTAVVNFALNKVIAEVNKASGSYSARMVHVNAWKAMMCMEELDMEKEFKFGRFKKNMDSLDEMIPYEDRLLTRRIVRNGLGFLTIDSSSEFHLRTELEFFQSCSRYYHYQAYVLGFPRGHFVSEARQKMEQLEKDGLEKCTTIKECEEFLKEFPDSLNADVVRNKIKEFKEKDYWDKCKKKSLNGISIDGCKEYLLNYPNGNFVEEARALIERIEEERKLDNEAWNSCSKKVDFEGYLNRFPKGLHKEDAKKKIEEIESQRIRLTWGVVVFGIGCLVMLIKLFGS